MDEFLSSVRFWSGGAGPAAKMRKRIEKYVPCSMSFDDFAHLAISKGLQELEQNGSIRMPYAPNVLEPDLARRMAELDRAMELQDGLANIVVKELLDDLLNGEAHMIYDGWDLDDPAELRSRFIKLIRRWRKQLGMPPLPESKVPSVKAWGEPTQVRHKAKLEKLAQVKREGGATITVIPCPKVNGVKVYWRGANMNVRMSPSMFRVYERKAERQNLPNAAHVVLKAIERQVNQAEGRVAA